MTLAEVKKRRRKEWEIILMQCPYCKSKSAEHKERDGVYYCHCSDLLCRGEWSFPRSMIDDKVAKEMES